MSALAVERPDLHAILSLKEGMWPKHRGKELVFIQSMEDAHLQSSIRWIIRNLLETEAMVDIIAKPKVRELIATALSREMRITLLTDRVYVTT